MYILGSGSGLLRGPFGSTLDRACCHGARPRAPFPEFSSNAFEVKKPRYLHEGFTWERHAELSETCVKTIKNDSKWDVPVLKTGTTAFSMFLLCFSMVLVADDAASSFNAS